MFFVRDKYSNGFNIQSFINTMRFDILFKYFKNEDKTNNQRISCLEKQYWQKN